MKTNSPIETPACQNVPVATRLPRSPAAARRTDGTLPTRDEFLAAAERRVAEPLVRGIRVMAWARPDGFSRLVREFGVVGSEEVLLDLDQLLLELRHPADLCVRIGGTEFAMLLERGTMKEVEAWLQQLGRSLATRSSRPGGRPAGMTSSIGVCELFGPITSVPHALNEAWDACRRARLRGDGQILLSAKSCSARSTRRTDQLWRKRIQDAIQENRFCLVRHPVVHLDGRAVKVRDIWLRMVDENGNVVPAREFIPIASRLGLMCHIDRWVIASTVTYCLKREPDLVFVRLSRSSLLDDSLPDWLHKLFADSTIKPSRICFQVSEAVARRLLRQTIRQSKRLAAIGARFAVAQISADSSSSTVLHHVPMEFMRLDAALLQKLAWDQAVHDRVRRIIEDARRRGIRIIAERVEDAATMAALCQLKVDFVQGEYLHRDTVVLEETMTICLPTLPSSAPTGTQTADCHQASPIRPGRTSGCSFRLRHGFQSEAARGLP